MGWIALRSIDASDGRLGGRRLAIAAILIGLLMLPVQFFGLQSIQSVNESMLRDGIQRAVGAIFDVENEERARLLQQSFVASDSRRPSRAEVDSFAAQVTEKLGAYRSVSIAQSVAGDSSLFQPEYQLALVFVFEGGRATGGAECVLVPTGGALKDSLHIRHIEIDLGGGEVVQIPPAKESQESSSDENPAPSQEPSE